MDQYKGDKINKLITSWPHGAVYTTGWLYRNGYGYDLLNVYRKGNWIKAIGTRGAVVKTGDLVSWKGGVYAMQEQLGLTIHPASVTALALHGVTHYLNIGREQVWLFGEPGEKLPRWFKDHDWAANVRYRATTLFSEKSEVGMSEIGVGSFAIRASSRERAVMELLSQVPEVFSFDFAQKCFEGLFGLRPKILQELLVVCSSHKTKRLFLFFADELGMPWFEKLDLEGIDLGSGKRQLAQGGRFVEKYLITVPKDLKFV